MKQLSFFAAFFLFFITNCVAQDIMTKTNGEYLDVKVIEVNQTEIKYKTYDNPNGPIYIIYKKDVVKIRYENGTVEEFEGGGTNKPIPNYPNYNSGNLTSDDNSIDMYARGRDDARKYYYRYNWSANGTLCTTVGCGAIIGLIPAVSTSLTVPKEKNLSVPDKTLLENLNYKRGYTEEARRIKSKKVWRSYGVGVAINVAIGLVILATQ